MVLRRGLLSSHGACSVRWHTLLLLRASLGRDQPERVVARSGCWFIYSLGTRVPERSRRAALRDAAYVRSTVGADGAWVFTQVIPLSRAVVDEYNSLVPIT